MLNHHHRFPMAAGAFIVPMKFCAEKKKTVLFFSQLRLKVLTDSVHR